MKKLKILYLTLTIIGVSIVIIFLSTNVFSNKNYNIISNDAMNRKVYSSSLAMMLETSYESGEYQETTDSTWEDVIAKGFIFNSELSRCENGSTLTWNNNDSTVTFTGNISDKCYVYFDKVPSLAELCSNGITFADCIKTYVYTEDGENGLYYHDGLGTYGEYEAGDYSYRYSGADPDNYVCFGTDEETCPTDNLYRIIGVFDGRVKLIKYDYATSTSLGTDGAYYGSNAPNNSSYYKGALLSIDTYYWNNSTSTNTWSEANLNIMNLNTSFLTRLGSTWEDQIDDTTWIVGGNTNTNIYSETNSKAVYDNEMTNPATSDIYTSKIGLIYVSEYRYGADPTQSNSWSNLASNRYSTVSSFNWMYMGEYEWAITDFTDYSSGGSCWYLGSLVRGSCGYTAVRPSFNLKSSVVFLGGTGTADDPFRI